MDWRRRIERAEDRAWAALSTGAAGLVARLRAGVPQPEALRSLQANAALALALLLVAGLSRQVLWAWGAGAVLLIGLAWPRAGRALARAWLGLAHALGWVNGRVLLTLLYGLVLLPLALLRRWQRRRLTGSGDDPRFARVAPRQTTFVARNHSYTRDDLLKPW